MKYKVKNLEGLIVVEFHELNLPEPVVLNYIENEAYKQPLANGRRWYGDIIINRDEINVYFNNLIHEVVLPNVVEFDDFKIEYPYGLQFIKNNITVEVSTLKDEIGWMQPFHYDPRIYILAGSFHLQDSESNGTKFYKTPPILSDDEPFYIAPSKKNSGACWINTRNSGHSVSRVTSDRFLYLLNGMWNLNYNNL